MKGEYAYATADRPILERFPVTLHSQNQALERNMEERKREEDRNMR